MAIPKFGHGEHVEYLLPDGSWREGWVRGVHVSPLDDSIGYDVQPLPYGSIYFPEASVRKYSDNYQCTSCKKLAMYRANGLCEECCGSTSESTVLQELSHVATF